MTQDSNIVSLHGGAAGRAQDKLRTVAELGTIAEQARARGQKVVLAHGAFDLLHLGHVRHLETARGEGDILMVTLTDDEHINKGPGRPVFPQAMRAEMLAALQIVDWTAISHHPTAEQVLHEIKPDVYVKGPDYRDPDDDVTGKIVDEREVVEKYGGRLVITDDITFSSSALINRYIDHLDPGVRNYLAGLRKAERMDEIFGLIERVSDMRVLIVGDTIIDEYNYVLPLGKSPKENMIATQAQGSEIFAGGVIAAANHVAGLCAEVQVLTLLGDTESYEALVQESLKPNCKLTAVHRPSAPTTRKTRFIDPGYMRKLFEVYQMDDSPLTSSLQSDVDGAIADVIADYDLVVVTDFGHGMIGRSTMALLAEKARFLAVNAQTNSGNAGFNLVTKYPRADYVCIDAPEARLAVGDKFADIEDMAATLLPGRIDCRKIAVTYGARGCVTCEVGGESHLVPALTKTVVDTVGAGDAFFAVTSPLAAIDAPMDLLAFVGNLAGAIKVGIVGHRQSVDRVSLVKAVTASLK